MTEHLKTTLLWLTTSGIKIIGILVAFFILSQMSRWIVRWMERFVPEKDPLQAADPLSPPRPFLGRNQKRTMQIINCKVINDEFHFHHPLVPPRARLVRDTEIAERKMISGESGDTDSPESPCSGI